jgi:pimeloyl-ACP methyl ester carboxylesterase
MSQLPPLAGAVVPSGIRSRFVSDINALRMHVLEAGFEERGRPLALLLHGFPELAYSWRKVMVPLAAAGFHVIAPDQRGYGRTTGWDPNYDGDLSVAHDWLHTIGVPSSHSQVWVKLAGNDNAGAKLIALCIELCIPPVSSG